MFLRNISRRLPSLLSRPKRQFSTSLLIDTDGLNEDQISIQKAAHDFSKTKLLPNALEWDHKEIFPVDVMKEAAQMGFAAIYTKPEHGGCGLGRTEASAVFEQLSAGCVSTAAYLSIHNMTSWIIDTFGNEEQKKEWLPRMATLDVLSSYCLTEPGSGSDAAAMQTTAVKDGNDYILNGSKSFISGGSYSGLYVVMCKTGPKEISTILVDAKSKGLGLGKKEQKMGWRSEPTTMVFFQDCRVPQRNLISKPGEGFKIAMKALDGGRINIASCSLGGASFAIEKTREYIKERKQFGKQLAEFQNIQFKLAEMATNLKASRLLVRNAARYYDEDHPEKTMMASMAKKFATDNCFDVANYCLQMHGGYGYLHEYGIERVVRDLRVHQILEGTNEIMRLIISRRLLKETQ